MAFACICSLSSPPPEEEQGGDCPHDYLLIIARTAQWSAHWGDMADTTRGKGRGGERRRGSAFSPLSLPSRDLTCTSMCERAHLLIHSFTSARRGEDSGRTREGVQIQPRDFSFLFPFSKREGFILAPFQILACLPVYWSRCWLRH